MNQTEFWYLFSEVRNNNDINLHYAVLLLMSIKKNSCKMYIHTKDISNFRLVYFLLSN